MAEYTLIKIDQLPIGTITESSPIMFGIGDEIYTCLASELIDLLPTESPNVRPRLVDLNITVLEANLGTFLASQNLTIASGEIVFIRFGVIRSNGFIGRDTYAVPLSDGIYEPLGTTISFSQLILINQENFNVNGDGNTVTYSFANIEEINASDPPIDFTDEDLVSVSYTHLTLPTKRIV